MTRPARHVALNFRMIRKRASCAACAAFHKLCTEESYGSLGGGPDGLARRRARRQLVALGARAMEGGWGVEPYGESGRDIHTFARRVGRLPEQRPGDALDYRPLLHRDGSVLSALTLEVGVSALLWGFKGLKGPGDALDYRPLLHRDGSVLSALMQEVGVNASPSLWLDGEFVLFTLVP